MTQITSKKIKAAKLTILRAYLDQHATGEFGTDPDLSMNELDIAKTLRRVNNEISKTRLEALGSEYPDFLLAAHIYLNGKDQKTIRATNLNEILNDFDKSTELSKKLGSQLLGAMLKDDDSQIIKTDEVAQKSRRIARFIERHMPLLINDIKQVPETKIESSAPLSHLDKLILNVSEYIDFGEGNHKNHCEFSDYQHRVYLKNKLNTKADFLNKIVSQSANENRSPWYKSRLVKSFAAAIATVGIALGVYANINKIPNPLLQITSIVPSFNTVSDEAPMVASYTPDKPVYGGGGATNVINSSSIVPVATTTPRMELQLSQMQDNLASVYNAASDIPEHPMLDLTDVPHFIKSVYADNKQGVSSNMQIFFDKIDRGLNTDNITVATVGAFDAARLMSQELGLDVVGFKSREVYEMIAKMNIVHPVTQWASDGAAMKLPSPSSQVTLASNSTYSVRLTPQG